MGNMFVHSAERLIRRGKSTAEHRYCPLKGFWGGVARVFIMKHLSQQTTNDREVPHQGCCAFKLRHYTALRRHARHGGRCGECGHFWSVMSGALSRCCGEYRSVSADGRTVVPIRAANSVHTSPISAKKRQKLYVFVQQLIKYIRVKIKIIYIHKWRRERLGNITGIF